MSAPAIRLPKTDAGGVLIAIAIAVVLLLGTRQAYTVPYTGLGLPPGQLILFVLGVLWLLTRAVGQRAPAGLGLLTGLVMFRLVAVLVSYGLGYERPVGVDQASSTNDAMRAEIIAAAVVIVLATVLRTRRDIEFVLRALVIGGAISATFAIIQFGTGTDLAGTLHLPGLTNTPSVLTNTPLLREGLSRPAGAAGHPLEFGGVMTVLTPIAAALFFAERRRGRPGWWWAVLTVVIVAGGVVSLSRSFFLGIAAAVLVMLVRWPLRRVGALLAVVLAALIGAWLVGGQLFDAIAKLLTKGSGDYSLGSRADGRTYVWAHVGDHFWFGQGPGTYDLAHQPVLDNQYLGQLIETGALGLILFVAVLVCALIYAFAATTRRAAADAVELANGLVGALVAVLVVTAILDTSGFVQISTLQWILVGVVGALWRLNTRPAEPAVSPRAVVAVR